MLAPGTLRAMNDTDFFRALNPGHRGGFDETNWWVVDKAGHPDQPQAEEARALLCRTYWYPVYGYICRLGHTHQDAQDLTQEFFARVLEKNYLQAAAAEKGRFRSFLLLLLKRFLADEWDRARRQKRGGGVPMVSLDAADTRFLRRQEFAEATTPDKAFDLAWAESLLRHALESLEQELAAAGKEATFRELKACLTGDNEVTCAATAERLGMSVSNLKVTVHRLRARLRDLVRAEIANTANSPEEVEAEVRDLYAALR